MRGRDRAGWRATRVRRAPSNACSGRRSAGGGLPSSVWQMTGPDIHRKASDHPEYGVPEPVTVGRADEAAEQPFASV